MPHDLVFHNGLVVTPTGLLQGGVAVDGEIITAVGPRQELGGAAREIDLEGRVLFPGVIDPHVHFGIGDELSDEVMEQDFALATKDCLLGGVTTLCTTTIIAPVPLTELLSRGLACGRRSWCDYKFNITVTTREQIADIPTVVAQGGASFKFFTGYTGAQAVGFGMSPEGIPPDIFYEACEAIAASGPPAFAMIHAEEPTVREMRIERLRGDPATRGRELVAWADSTPAWGESIQLYTYGLVANHVGVTLYPVHISRAHTLDTFRYLRAQGISLVGETLVLFLCSTAEEMNELGVKAKIQPPLRHAEDRDALWRAVADGTITIAGTDGLSYTTRYRESDVDFWDARVGVNQHFPDVLPLMLHHGYHAQRADLQTLAKLLSENAARRYGMYPRKGAIAVGSDADLVVIDLDREVTLGVERYRGVADFCIWEGRQVRGLPVMTVLKGQVAMEEGEIVADQPAGEFIRGIRRPDVDHAR